ncbi:hypothetical protein [Halomonas sp. BC04]|uniref:hypothetical protein n=1 Tax=Halomonas sp. BC04 TaxID=1403540 RepID=UPI0012DD392F|nr:hypothetical protein [Halomonas sp. BC04]
MEVGFRVVEFVGPAASGKTTVSNALEGMVGEQQSPKLIKRSLLKLCRCFLQPLFFLKAFLFCRKAGVTWERGMLLKVIDLGLAQGVVWLQKKSGMIVLSQGISRDVWKCCKSYNTVCDWAEPVSKLLLPDVTVVVSVEASVRSARSNERKKVKKYKRINRYFGDVGANEVGTDQSLELLEEAMKKNGVKVVRIDTLHSPEYNAEKLLQEILP